MRLAISRLLRDRAKTAAELDCGASRTASRDGDRDVHPLGTPRRFKAER
ncbi:hypothetical protein COLINT_03193 [Collinsella intestinalis DSM 13280]|uniref:Uncharacterized protein n=1 Tax=Collinsella intestinalis DSM 13280 TaxID=521003 RepID=C4FAU7_9ACTN|nr:hypothetical protein COLINT_03193 [Collinsella intestinalis DSM 13280]